MGQHILLFESDPAFAQEVQSNFESLGATVDIAGDGAHGLDLAGARRPDLILLSIELPGMNGFLVCKKIKKQDDLQGVPLLIMSSEATEDVFEQHKKLRTRADDYIHKPIAFSDLLDRVKRFVAFEANGVSLDGGDAGGPDGIGEAIEISDLEEDEVILVADEDDDEEPESNRVEAEAFAQQAVEMLTSDAPEVTLPIERPQVEARRSSVPVASAAPPAAIATEPITAVSALDIAASEGAAVAQHEVQLLRARVAELETELGKASRRTEQADEEAQAAKQRAAAAERSLADASKKGGVSSRDFLDLREQLNRKDRELLGLRDQVTARDKQLIEASDRGLTLERELADLADKHVDVQREFDKARETLEALQADKDGAKKRLDDLKARLERAEARSRELSEELGGINAANAKELEALEQRHAEALEAAEARHAQAIEALRGEHAAAIEALRRSHAGELAEQKDEHEMALAGVREQIERQKDALTAELRAEAEAQSRERLEAQQREHEARVSEAQAAHERELASARQSLQEQLAAEQQKANERFQQESARLGRALAEAGTHQQLLQDQLEEAEAAKNDAQARLERMVGERDRALEQRKGEEQIVDRARTALGIALSLLEEHKHRAADPSEN